MPSLKATLNARFKEILSSDDLKEIAVAGLEASRKHTSKETKRGKNPNKGGGEYEPYSTSYTKKKGRSQPVDLRNEKNSIEKRRINKQKGTLEFRSTERGQVFNAHQSGRKTKLLDKVQRPIYPENEGEVPEVIQKAIVRRTEEILKKKYG